MRQPKFQGGNPTCLPPNFCFAHLQLALHPSGGPIPYRRGLAFLGYRIFRDHLRVKPQAVRRFTRRLAADLLQIPYRGPEGFEHLYRKVQAWVAHVKLADSHGLQRKVLGAYPVTEFMRANEFNLARMRHRLAWC